VVLAAFALVSLPGLLRGFGASARSGDSRRAMDHADVRYLRPGINRLSHISHVSLMPLVWTGCANHVDVTSRSLEQHQCHIDVVVRVGPPAAQI
jgi:hypothetical protein